MKPYSLDQEQLYASTLAFSNHRATQFTHSVPHLSDTSLLVHHYLSTPVKTKHYFLAIGIFLT